MKKAIKKILLILCMGIGTLVLFCGCLNSSTSKTFEKAGLSITLSDEFYEKEHVEYTAYYASSEMIVVTVKEQFSTLEIIENNAKWMSVEYYANLIIDTYRNFYNSASEVLIENDMVSFTYENDALGKDFQYMWYGFKATDAFWSVQFGCEKSDFDRLKAEMLEYAKTVQIEEFNETPPIEELIEELIFKKIANREEYRLTGLGSYAKYTDELIIPSEYNGLPVTQISPLENWGGSDSLKRIVVPDTVTALEFEVFSDLSNLKEVVLGNSVTKIGANAFADCEKLETIVFSDCIETIGSSAFSGCESLTELIFPNTLKTIGFRAFGYCDNLRKVDISSATDIDNELFSGCIGLTEVKLSPNLAKLGSFTFSGCTSLTEIDIPDSVTELGEGAFKSCTSLKNVSIPDSVSVVRDGVFIYCHALEFNEYDNACYLGNENNPYLFLVRAIDQNITSCDIHPNTKFIHSEAFKSCKKLTEIVIPDDVTAVLSYAFGYCNNLTCLTLGRGITTLSHLAFGECTKLFDVCNQSSVDITQMHFGLLDKKIYTERTESKIAVDKDGYFTYTDEGKTSLAGYIGEDKALTLPKGSTAILAYAFAGEYDLTEVNIPDGIESIGAHAFEGCSSLKKINVPDSLKTIENNAFDACGVEEINLGDGVETIGSEAFRGGALQKIELGQSLKEIGSYAFAPSNITEIIFPDSLISIGANAFHNCNKLTNVTFGDGLKSIGKTAFAHCYELQTVTFGNALERIEQGAFGWCWKLTELVFPQSLIEIGAEAFSTCKELQSVTFGDSLQKIGNDAFVSCPLKELTLPIA